MSVNWSVTNSFNALLFCASVNFSFVFDILFLMYKDWSLSNTKVSLRIFRFNGLAPLSQSLMIYKIYFKFISLDNTSIFDTSKVNQITQRVCPVTILNSAQFLYQKNIYVNKYTNLQSFCKFEYE